MLEQDINTEIKNYNISSTFGFYMHKLDHLLIIAPTKWAVDSNSLRIFASKILQGTINYRNI